MTNDNDPCLECGKETLKLITFTNGTSSRIGVNRLPADGGYLCGVCAGSDCDACGERIFLDEEITVEEDNPNADNYGDHYSFHDDCLSPEMRQRAIAQNAVNV